MDEDIDGINVVPLVDVMLVLLTIILTTATFIATGRIPVDLAEARNASAQQDASVFVTLTLHKVIYLDDQPVHDLDAALARLALATPIIIRADGGLALRDFVELADRIRSLGFERVSLEVRRT